MAVEGIIAFASSPSLIRLGPDNNIHLLFRVRLCGFMESKCQYQAPSMTTSCLGENGLEIPESKACRRAANPLQETISQGLSRKLASNSAPCCSNRQAQDMFRSVELAWSCTSCSCFDGVYCLMHGSIVLPHKPFELWARA